MPESTDPPDSPAGVGTLAYATPRREADWRTVCIAIVLVGVLVRLAYGFGRPAGATNFKQLPDQLEYLSTAESLLNGDGFGFEDASSGERVRAFRMPGYPLLIAACGANGRAVQILQALLDAATCAAVYQIARPRTTGVTTTLAVVGVAFNPYLIQFSTLLLSETLFTTCLAWGVCFLTSPKAGHRAAAVILLTLSVYVRPSAIGLGVAASAVAFARGPGTWRRITTMAAGGLAGAGVLAVVLLPWAARNKAVLGTWVWTTTNGGYTAYDSFNPRADGSSNQGFFRAGDGPSAAEADGPSPASRPLAAWRARRDDGEVARSARLGRMAWAYAVDHPRRDAGLAVAKLGRFWSPVPLSADFGGRWLYVVVGGGFAVPLFAFAAVGLWRGGLGRRFTLVLVLPAVYFSAVHCVFVGSLRYRVPCDAPLAVLAAAGVGSFVRPAHS